ncbi:hypothetical protein OHA79_39485 [Streptomyces sp. NBC_00841]|uniref:hypothetical protein n=1 Tax=unclassified Streptomyces TaxID=2593676 RepID=UPI00225124A1|nr:MULTISPECIES: hypothetical protein [unclassified Streptomyces]MCX4530880.1 hypothetical protein [Streptomyces sp. NBC_01669]WSA03373.1 hypothetical protein OHA79_39485 [Streptomyces sp. NBC_00841]
MPTPELRSLTRSVERQAGQNTRWNIVDRHHVQRWKNRPGALPESSAACAG